MRLQITPEPSKSERRAVERAVAIVIADGDPPRARWWKVGVEENLEGVTSEEAALEGESPAPS